MQLLLFDTSNANSKFKGEKKSEGRLEFFSLQPCTYCPGLHQKPVGSLPCLPGTNGS